MPAEPRLTGRPSKFRGKLRTRPMPITLTPEGHAALAAGQRATGLSRSDYIETLLRDAAARLPHYATPTGA